MLKVYTYAKCDACRKAVKFLRGRNIGFAEIPIRETPPSLNELRVMLKAKGGDLRRFFNTSGSDQNGTKLRVIWNVGRPSRLPSSPGKSRRDACSTFLNLVPFGSDYKVLGLSAKLPSMSESAGLELLAANGNLVKRPFAIGNGIHLIGFREDEWKNIR
jgi:arsenate reductase